MDQSEGTTDAVDALEAVLAHPAGYGVELMGVLFAFRMENAAYIVQFHRNGKPVRERIFTTPRDAAHCVIDWRRELLLGYDFETSMRRPS